MLLNCTFQKSDHLVFEREEALANIISVEMLDFPLKHLQEEFEDEFGSSNSNFLGMFIKRIKSQFFHLQVLRLLIDK